MLRRTFAVLLILATGAVTLAWPTTPSARAAEAGRTGPPAPRHGSGVVLVGVPGLLWSDLSPGDTPVLWRLAAEGSIASLSVRTIGSRTCPADGWLTVSAGSRAAYPRLPCGRGADVARQPDGSWRTGAVPDARRVNLRSNFRAAVGALGEAVHHAGHDVAAVGPGAVLAAADTGGRVDAFAPSPEAFDDWGRRRVTIVEVDQIVRPYLGGGVNPRQSGEVTAAERAAAVRRADLAIGAILTRLPAASNVIVAGTSDHSRVPQLRVAIGRGPSFPPGRYLRSASTRRDGMTILPDLTATVLDTAGLPVPAEVVGVPWGHGDAHGGLAQAVSALRGDDTAAQTVRTILPSFFIGFVVCLLFLYASAALALRGSRGGRSPRVMAAARAFALACAAVPVSTYLVNLLPWWKTSVPAATLPAAVLICAAALAALSLCGPWRRDVMHPGTVLAGITAAVSAADLLHGSPLQLNSLMGYSPLVGGRYYGLGNIAFATFATSTLFFAAGVAHILLRRRRPALAVACVIALGAAADLLSGAPGFGAKFGGTIALVPGTAVTALIVARRRVTPVRLLLSAGLGVATIAAICTLDYLRSPAQRTHLGRFAGQVLHGEAVPVVTRKMQAMLHTVGNIPLTLLTAAGLLFVFFVLLRGRTYGGARGDASGGPLTVAYEHAPALRAAVTGTLVTSMSGFAVEDSGIAVPAIALALAAPLAFAAAARAHRLDRITEPAAMAEPVVTLGTADAVGAADAVDTTVPAPS